MNPLGKFCIYKTYSFAAVKEHAMYELNTGKISVETNLCIKYSVKHWKTFRERNICKNIQLPVLKFHSHSLHTKYYQFITYKIFLFFFRKICI